MSYRVYEKRRQNTCTRSVESGPSLLIRILDNIGEYRRIWLDCMDAQLIRVLALACDIMTLSHDPVKYLRTCTVQSGFSVRIQRFRIVFFTRRIRQRKGQNTDKKQ